MIVIGISSKSLWAHKRRLVGTLLAVVFGVAFLSGTLLLGDTLRANFDALFTQANGGTDVVVRSATKVSDRNGQSNRADRRCLARRRASRTSHGVADGRAVHRGLRPARSAATARPSATAARPTRAGNWITVASLNPYQLVEGRAPEADDEVVINRGAAKTGDLRVGDGTTLLTPQPVRVHMVGIATFGSADGFGPSTFTGLTSPARSGLLTDNPDQ